jgi:hypothetical protein
MWVSGPFSREMANCICHERSTTLRNWTEKRSLAHPRILAGWMGGLAQFALRDGLIPDCNKRKWQKSSSDRNARDEIIRRKGEKQSKASTE